MHTTKNAFSLSEILITLGVIGVVAAITLSVLINKYKMRTYEVGLKREYAILQNVVNYVNAEESLVNCYITYRTGSAYKIITDDCSALRENLINKMQLTKIKKYDYKLGTQLIADNETVVNTSFTYHNNNKYQTSDYYYVLKDGSVVNLPLPVIIIDVNGKKAPNKWGYDVFYMHLIPDKTNTRLILSDNLAGLAEKGGKLARTILRNEETNTDTKYYRD